VTIQVMSLLIKRNN